MCNGFKQISNDFFESDYWRQSRTYNDCEAVLDIITQVRFEASEHTARIGGRDVTWGQAEWPASIRFLAQRWHWSDRRVRTFLTTLKKRNVISTDDSQGVNIIKLQKYIVINETKESDTANDTANALNINQLADLVTQRMTQQKAEKRQKRHSGDTKQYIGDIFKEDSSLRSESEEAATEEVFNPQEIVDFYNLSIKADGCCLPKCIRLTDKRKTLINARLKEYGKDKVFEAITKVVNSKFCNGLGTTGWKADIDFIFNVNNMPKILEGRYDSFTPSGDNTSLRNNSSDKFQNGFSW
jgi:hypothetical protein